MFNDILTSTFIAAAAQSLQSCPALCDTMDCSLPGSSVHGILQARILKWVAMLFSRGSSWPRNWTQISCLAGRFFTAESPRNFYTSYQKHWACLSTFWKNLNSFIFVCCCNFKHLVGTYNSQYHNIFVFNFLPCFCIYFMEVCILGHTLTGHSRWYLSVWETWIFY